MSQMLAFVLIVAILYVGDIVSVRTKAWVPSVFVCATLFLAGYWTFFPKEIVSIGGITPALAVLIMYILVVNMGTLLSIEELKRQWKTVVISLAGIAGLCALAGGLGMLLFDRNTVVVGIPPLVGGLVSSLIMSKGAEAAGLMQLSVFAIILYVMQGFAGYPLTAIMLQREGRRVLSKYRAGEWSLSAQEAESKLKEMDVSISVMPRMFKFAPGHYNTDYFKFLRLGLVSLLSYLVSTWLAPFMSISPFVLCLVFGVLATSVGFLEKQPLYKANSFGFAVMGLMLFIFDTLKHATPDMLLGLVFPLVVFIACAVVGMFITSAVVGKMLGVSPAMAYAVSLTALYGFPADYVITMEAVNSLTKDPAEREVLTSHMLGSMLVGGFISVTMVSVLLAGILVAYIVPAA